MPGPCWVGVQVLVPDNVSDYTFAGARGAHHHSRGMGVPAPCSTLCDITTLGGAGRLGAASSGLPLAMAGVGGAGPQFHLLWPVQCGCRLKLFWVCRFPLSWSFV